MNQNIHNFLKENTRKLHHEVEQTCFPEKLFYLNITKSEYLEYIQIMYALHVNIEREISKFKEYKKLKFNINDYFRKHLAYMDLIIMSDNNIQPYINNIQDYDIKISSFKKSLGYLYVLTGSCMGGQILRTKVEQNFIDTKYQHAYNYFSAFKDATYQRWNLFLEFLKENSNDDDNEILDGAKECYIHIIKALDGK